MKLTFFWVAPAKSRMVNPDCAPIWAKNSSRPRLVRTAGDGSDVPFRGAPIAPPGLAPCGVPFPGCPLRDLNIPFSGPGSNIWAPYVRLALALRWDRGRIGVRRRRRRIRRFRRGLRRFRLHNIDTALKVR